MSRSTRTLRASVLSAVLLVAASACGSDDDGESTAGTSTNTSANTSGSTSASTTVAAADATTAATAAAEITDPSTTAGSDAAAEAPTKIISLSPTATEMLWAIGAGDQVIAVDDQSNFPEEALEKQTDLSGFTPNVEAIAAYEPDLVVIEGTVPDLQSQLEQLDIPVWVGTAAVTFDDVYAQIEQLGAATGHVGEAAELVGQMQADLEAAVASVPQLNQPPSFYHELDPTFYSVTSNTLIGHVYQLFGLVNIADTVEGTTDYPQLSAEFIISQNPDLIFLADTKCCGETAETVAARDGWDAISAVVTGNVILVDDDIASRWGPRVIDHVEAVAAAVADVALLSAG